MLKEQLASTVDTYVKYIDVDTGTTVRAFFNKVLNLMSLNCALISGCKNQWRSGFAFAKIG